MSPKLPRGKRLGMTRQQTENLILSHRWDMHSLGMSDVSPKAFGALVKKALLRWPEIRGALTLPVSRFPQYIREGREPMEGEQISRGSGQRGVPEKPRSGHPGASEIPEKGVNGVEMEDLAENGKSASVMEMAPVYGGKGLPNGVEIVMPVIQEGSKPLLNCRHEDFAQGMVMGGKPQWQVYMEVYKCSRETAEDCAWRLMAEPDKFGIVRRFTFLREQVASAKVLTAQERREFLASVVRTPVGSVNEHSPLAQEVTYEENERGSRTKVKMPGKLEALKLDAEMAGELSPMAQLLTVPIQLNIALG